MCNLLWDGGLWVGSLELLRMGLSSENKRRKVNRGSSFLRPRFQFLLCGSA